METTTPQPTSPIPEKEKKLSPATQSSPSNISLILLAILTGVVGLGLVIVFLIIPYINKPSLNPSLIPSSTPTGSTTTPNSPTTSQTLPSQSTIPSSSSEPPVFTSLEQEFPELINNKTGLFSAQAKTLLKKNGFVAIPADNQEFFNLYQTNTEKHLPNFITTDSLLHTTNLIFTHLHHKLGDQKTSTAYLLNSTIEQLKLRTITPEYVPAIFGSASAQKILADMGTPLPSNSSTVETNPRITGPVTLAPESYDIYPLLPLITTKPGNLPSFMTNDAWGYKDLTTFLGSWIEIISSSTTSTPLAMTDGIGGPDDEVQAIDDRGYVEPEPLLYDRITELTQQLRIQLDKTKKLSSTDHSLLLSLEKTSATLKAISQSEINKIPLSEDAHTFIKNYGEWLESVWEQTHTDSLAKNNGNIGTTLAQFPAATLATAATFPDQTVLQTGTGKIFDLFVIVTVNGKQKLAHGGIYSYYEFTKPITSSFSPSTWQQLISNTLNSTPPQLPVWTKNYLDTSLLEVTK